MTSNWACRPARLPMNDQPPYISRRKKLQLVVILTILAWATQTLFHQWGYSAVITPTAGNRIATIEIRQQGTIFTSLVHLRDIARWSSADAATLAPYAETVIGDLQVPELVRRISATQIAAALHDAGISLATVRLTGFSDCEVTRSATASWTPQAMPHPVQPAIATRIPVTLAPAALANDPAATTRPVQAVAPDVAAAPTTQPARVEVSVPATQPVIAAVPATQASFAVRPGDFITVTFDLHGGQFQTVLRAIDGANGPTVIRAKNEATGETYFVQLWSATAGKYLPYVVSSD